MPNSKKLLQAAAGAAGGEALNVEDVFSTYLYTGNSTARTITNGIDLSGEGGLVWSKTRNVSVGNGLVDTETGPQTYLVSETSAALRTDNYATLGLTAFNSDGYSLGVDTNSDRFNRDTRSYVSWTFRKAPKFFDVVTFSTTTGSSTPITVNHNLGSVPGVIIVKTTSITGDWFVFHRSLGSTKYLDLSSTDQAQTGGTSKWASAPTDTSFTLGGDFVQNATYVAYLFAHNDGDGEFGPDGDQDIIKCGSYTGNSTIGHTIDLGFEAQWVLVRSTSNLRKWMLYDAMRGMPVVGNGAALYPNSTDGEESLQRIGASNVGFQLTSTDSMVNVSGETYIYIAIRRGPMAVPESATDVWDTSVANFSAPAFEPGFNADMVWVKRPSQTFDTIISARLMQGKFLETTSTAGESTGSFYEYDYQDAWGSSAVGSTYRGWSWKRAPKFLDVVSYVGNGSSNTINHNLGVVPEMIVTKKRTGGTAAWAVVLNDHNSGLGYLKFNETDQLAATTYNVHPNRTATSYGLNADGITNNSGHEYIAFLFASLDGISKVGTYTGNGGSQTIDCGFSAGARFVLIKCLDITSSWLMFDTDRGIVAGNDPAVVLNSDQAQITTNDYIDPDNSGFAFDTSNALVNGSGNEYMFYAVA